MTVQEVLTNKQKIEALVGNVENLPTAPFVFAQINRAVSDANTSAYDFAAILSEDPVMSAKVLKLCKSAFYGLPNPISTVKQAIVILV
jgi:HD-like signal output (HDOD) protein